MDDSVVTLTLNDGTFEQDVNKIRDALSVSGIPGVTINRENVQRLSDEMITVVLDSDNTRLSRDTWLTFSLSADAILNYAEGALRASIPVSSWNSQAFIYWVDYLAGTIKRANLDGSNIKTLVSSASEPHSIALDMVNGKMYWTDEEWDHVRRADLDGTNIETVVARQDDPYGIALDVAGGKVYWTDEEWDIIRRANLDGTNIETVVPGLEDPYGIALDVDRGKMYWTDPVTGKIQRANLDGPNIEDLVTRVGGRGIALDLGSGKMYWTNVWVDKIQRANLDGSNIEDLVTEGLDLPNGIALDVVGRKMYWTNVREKKIQRANLDGPNIEDLVTEGLIFPTGIAVSVTPRSPVLAFSPPTIADQRFTVNTLISPLQLPVATGGTSPYTYTLSPIPDGLNFNGATQLLTGTPTTVGSTNATYTVTDATSATAALNFTIEVIDAGVPADDPLDVNGDGQVDVLDLVLVAVFYGTRGDGLPADVNADGVVNVQDLIAVAAAIDASGAALPQALKEALLTAAAEEEGLEAIGKSPMVFSTPEQVSSAGVVYSNVAAALADAKRLMPGDVRLRKWVPVLEEFLHLLAEMRTIPETTALLPNYPNPFNPETWIPYHLATDADVTLTIYDIRGSVVRELIFGHQPAGVYESRGRAAYWDGRNQIGEPVASGLYFYTLTAGEFTATRKLLIAK